jgi:hypothetical protein
MHEKRARVFLTSWTFVGCLLEIIAPVAYLFLWNNKLFYQTLMAIGLIMITLRIILAGGIFLASVNMERNAGSETTTFVKFNTRQSKWSILIILILMALNMMLIHV